MRELARVKKILDQAGRRMVKADAGEPVTQAGGDLPEARAPRGNDAVHLPSAFAFALMRSSPQTPAPCAPQLHAGSASSHGSVDRRR